MNFYSRLLAWSLSAKNFFKENFSSLLFIAMLFVLLVALVLQQRRIELQLEKLNQQVYQIRQDHHYKIQQTPDPDMP